MIGQANDIPICILISDVYSQATLVVHAILMANQNID